MGFTLDSFASECHRILKQDPSPAGREKVRDLVQEALKDHAFVESHINDNTPERQVIYEDPELGFCICAHANRDAREANPHDQSFHLLSVVTHRTVSYRLLRGRTHSLRYGRFAPCSSPCVQLRNPGSTLALEILNCPLVFFRCVPGLESP